jgi:adenylate cyclase
MDDQASIVRCIQAGADDNLIKPIDQVLLQARLGASLERKRLRDQESAVHRQIETYNLALEQRVREQVAQITATELERAKLSRYLSPSVVEQVLGAGQELALGGRRLEVTVLFTDIRGYTALSRQIDVGHVVELLNEHFTAVSEIIFQYGGTLDKFIGDSVMAVFGSPFASGSEARHAVLAAQDIQTMMERRNQVAAQTGMPAFEIGIGINTGDVISGNIGSPQKMDFTVIGSTVNLTARLTEMARGGEIMLGAATVAQLHGEFPVEPVGALELKHRPDVMECFRLLRTDYRGGTASVGKGG